MGVDILAANADGSSSLCIQVKTAWNARKDAYGQTGFNWDVGVATAGNYSPNLWYAFVDLQRKSEGGDAIQPNVYFVPSRWVGMFVERTWTRKLFYLTKDTIQNEGIENNWDAVQLFLNGERATQTWAQSLPKTFYWWGSKRIFNPSDSGYVGRSLDEALSSGEYCLDDNNCIQLV